MLAVRLSLLSVLRARHEYRILLPSTVYQPVYRVIYRISIARNDERRCLRAAIHKNGPLASNATLGGVSAVRCVTRLKSVNEKVNRSA